MKVFPFLHTNLKKTALNIYSLRAMLVTFIIKQLKVLENCSPTTVIGCGSGIIPNRANGTSMMDFKITFVHFSHLLRPV